MSKETISTFYQSFQQLDAEAMVACYHPDIHFHDPAFGDLHGKHAANMWRMLCQNQKGKGMEIDFEIISENTAHWEARYIFSKTGKRVHNLIDAHFEFSNGLIIEHKDAFNLYRWAGMAFGFQGKLLGWTPYFRKKLQQQTNGLLQKFESRIL